MTQNRRIELLAQLGEYMLSTDPAWLAAKEQAGRQNSWFIPAFIETATHHIGSHFLQAATIEKWTAGYAIPGIQPNPKKIGIVMAGNLPLVGFHDWLCVFLSGHTAIIKPSSKDDVLIRHLLEKLASWDAAAGSYFSFAPLLKDCDAYIATGSNNTAGYFNYYFGKYPHIIRKNRTSVAVLSGEETPEALELLADDVHLYFGLGCRNVTKLYVPNGYDFVPLLTAFRKYNYLADHHKYKNNYDYNLAIHILNKQYYMTNEAILLVEDEALFSPVSQLNYSFYHPKEELITSLGKRDDIQCIVGNGQVPFGQSQFPAVNTYADSVDTLLFLSSL